MSFLKLEQIEAVIKEFKDDCKKSGFEGDWWTAISDKYDVNLFLDDDNPDRMIFTIYPLINGSEPDYTNFTRLLTFDVSKLKKLKGKNRKWGLYGKSKNK